MTLYGWSWARLKGMCALSRFRKIPELLTAKELEALLKIDVKTIYSYVQRVIIPYVKIQSNVRFVKEQILEWIEQQNYRPRSMDRNGRN